jgi:predicted SAM-dependent methyltransferase
LKGPLQVLSSIKKVFKSSAASVWPKDVVATFIFESKATAKHFRTWVFGRSTFRGQTHLKLNIGCGANVAKGWVNLDLDGPPEVFRWDCRRGLPFDDGSVKKIFAEHVFEHFDPVTGSHFLNECRRCLEAGGVVRIVVPDAGKYLNLYQGDWSGFVPVRPLIPEDGGYRDYWLNNIYKTKMEFINEIFRQGTEHKYAYDAETLTLKMRNVGFAQVLCQQYLVSSSPEKPLDTEARSSDSLYVEGIK